MPGWMAVSSCRFKSCNWGGLLKKKNSWLAGLKLTISNEIRNLTKLWDRNMHVCVLKHPLRLFVFYFSSKVQIHHILSGNETGALENSSRGQMVTRWPLLFECFPCTRNKAREQFQYSSKLFFQLPYEVGLPLYKTVLKDYLQKRLCNPGGRSTF